MVQSTNAETKIVLFPDAKDKLSDVKISKSISVAIGPKETLLKRK